MSDAELIQKAKTAKVANVMCHQSLMFHTRYFFKAQYKRKFIIGQHHEIIANALERVLSGKLKRVIFNVAPRYGKTEIAVKSFISHGLSLNPSSKYIHLSYSDSLALDNSESIKDLVQSSDYQELFPEVQIKKDSKAKEKWYTTAGGGVLARAAGGAVTGFGAGQVDDPEKMEEQQRLDEELKSFAAEIENGYAEALLEKKWQFAGAIVIDDPIKPEDADSDTQRGKVNDRFDSTVRNRVNSRNTPIIVIMQRLHPLDLSGYLMREGEQDEWEVISLPCLYFNENNEKQALWPFKETVEELEKQRIANEVVFERQKQQNPAPKTGLMFPLSELHFYDPDQIDLSDPDFQYLPVDPANEGGDDFAAGPTKLIGNRIYIPEILYNTDGTDINEPAVTEMVLRNKVNFVGVEGVMGWKETANRIRDDLNDRNFEGEFRVLHPRTGKHARITNRQSFIRNHFYFRKDWADFPQYAKFMRILTAYLKIQEPGKMNKKDDAPDWCEMAAAYYEKNFPHLWKNG